VVEDVKCISYFSCLVNGKSRKYDKLITRRDSNSQSRHPRQLAI